MAEGEIQPHVVMFPHPALSHTNPMMELAARLLSYNFCITFIGTSYVDPRVSPSFSPISPHARIRFRFIGSPTHSRIQGSLRERIAVGIKAIDGLHSPFQTVMQDIVTHPSPAFSQVSCIIGDFYFPWIQAVADSFNIPRVVFWTTAAHIDLLYLYQPLLVSKKLMPFQDKNSTIDCVPGVIAHPATQTHTYFAEDDILLQWCLTREAALTKKALWNLGNNVCELEGRALETLKNDIGSFLPIGPLLPSAFVDGGHPNEEDAQCKSGPNQHTELDIQCLRWLDGQKRSSVLYVSFGSIGGSSGQTQLEELALGVEASGQPFLWAMKDPKSPIFHDFQERTKLQGLVVQWAPQLQVLSHAAVMGFVTQCGWNSILESATAGVPMLAMPAVSDQMLNSKYVVEEWKLGLELRSEREDGLVTREVVEKGVRALICKVGEEGFKQRMSEVGRACRGAAMPGGSSHVNIETFVRDLRSRVPKERSFVPSH